MISRAHQPFLILEGLARPHYPAAMAIVGGEVVLIVIGLLADLPPFFFYVLGPITAITTSVLLFTTRRASRHMMAARVASVLRGEVSPIMQARGHYRRRSTFEGRMTIVLSRVRASSFLDDPGEPWTKL